MAYHVYFQRTRSPPIRTADVAFVPLFAGMGFDRLLFKSRLLGKFCRMKHRVRGWRHRGASLFVVREAGWTNSMINLVAGLRAGGGGLWRSRSWGGHAGGGFSANYVVVRPPPRCVDVWLHVGIRGSEAVETNACISMIGGADCRALGSGPVRG
jgi:hypothetical protein